MRTTTIVILFFWSRIPKHSTDLGPLGIPDIYSLGNVALDLHETKAVLLALRRKTYEQRSRTCVAWTFTHIHGEVHIHKHGSMHAHSWSTYAYETHLIHTLIQVHRHVPMCKHMEYHLLEDSTTGLPPTHHVWTWCINSPKSEKAWYFIISLYIYIICDEQQIPYDYIYTQYNFNKTSLQHRKYYIYIYARGLKFSDAISCVWVSTCKKTAGA